MPTADLLIEASLLPSASPAAVAVALSVVVAGGVLLGVLPGLRNRQYRRAVEHDPGEGRTSHDIDYRIRPRDSHLQYLEIGLDPGETVVAQRGALLYAEDGITYKARLVSEPGAKRMFALGAAFRRRIAGEAMWLSHFTNTAKSGKRVVALATPRMGQIVAVDLTAVGGELIAEREAFFAMAAGTRIGLSLRRGARAGLFGGEGFVLQRLTGDGYVFLHAHGSVFQRDIDGGSIHVDTGCIVALESGVDYSARLAGSVATVAFGGEGVFLSTLSGHGKVWLQSQHLPKPPRRGGTPAARRPRS